MSYETYADDIDGAYEDIAEAGGPIKLYRPATVPDDGTEDTGTPWLGTDVEPAYVDHVASIVPMSSVVQQNTDTYAQMALIPAKGLDFRLSEELKFKDAAGRVWQIEDFLTIIPDAVNPILYIAKVTGWPTR